MDESIVDEEEHTINSEDVDSEQEEMMMKRSSVMNAYRTNENSMIEEDDIPPEFKRSVGIFGGANLLRVTEV